MKILSAFAALIFAAPMAFAIDGGHEITAQDPAAKSLVQVFLWDEGSQEGSACTGTLIAPDLVVTAAHCVFSDLDAYLAHKSNGGLGDPKVSYSVYRGSMPKGWNKKKPAFSLLGKGRGWMPVKSVHIPPGFGHTEGSPHYNSDVALIQVNAKSAGVPFAAIPVLTSLEHFQFEQQVRVVGAGPKTKEESKDFVHLFRTLGAFVSSQMDQATNTQDIVFQNDDGLSADCTNQYIGLDFGDSGGPAFLTVNDREYIWGVDSQGGTYTVLPLVSNWMNQVAIEVGSSARF